MNLFDRLHCLHRFWRYRLITEKESFDYLLNLDLANTTCIDIGANKGAYSYWFSKKSGKNGQVIACEPQPELAPFLEDVKQTFDLQNLTIINKAASKESCKKSMTRKYAGHGGAQIIEKTGNDISIDCITLDSLLANMKSTVSFIKCDVEGHELEVFQGAESLLRMYRPIIQVEIHHEAMLTGSTASFLKSLGYTGWFFKEKLQIPIDHFEQYSYPRADNHRNYFFEVTR